ncbi:MAG: PEP-CTERM sorting domain-containing protein, partial [Candidatus Omnitrophica bacterium]|nr:PEP-CTERM sorting domain-containing protein [Candidatus Omnitrophota bacterium]
SFGDMPFSPRDGGVVADPTTDPVNGNPDAFAGESSTGATFRRFFACFDFKSATGIAQNGLSVTVSADNGSGGRQSFFDLEDNGSGIDVTTYDYGAGAFAGPVTIASGLSYADWINIAVEVLFYDGAGNDVVNYYLNGSLIHTSTSWEEYYNDYQATQHPLGVPVQSLLYRVSDPVGIASVSGGGFYIDNVKTEVTDIPEPTTIALIGAGVAALAGRKKRLI